MHEGYRDVLQGSKTNGFERALKFAKAVAFTLWETRANLLLS